MNARLYGAEYPKDSKAPHAVSARLTSPGAPTVVARKQVGFEWEPLYAVKDGAPVELPSCFSLSDEALAVLMTFEEKISWHSPAE